MFLFFFPVKLLRNLHLFYLNRLLRMFPILATFILIQASFLNRIADGPYWTIMSIHTHRCRVYWWSTLLYIQNFLNPPYMVSLHWWLYVDIITTTKSIEEQERIPNSVTIIVQKSSIRCPSVSVSQRVNEQSFHLSNIVLPI